MVAVAEVGPLRVRLRAVGPLDTQVTRTDTPLTALTEFHEGQLDEAVPLNIRWTGGGFRGRHWLLGKFGFDVKPAQGELGAAATGSTGTVVPATTNVRPEGVYFPAINDNELWFSARVGALGDLDQLGPVRNSAVIRQIPPIGTEYRLREPVAFRSARWARLQARIIECVVETLAEENLDAQVRTIAREGEEVVVVVDVWNRTESRVIRLVWHAEATSSSGSDTREGAAWLTRRRRIRIRFDGRLLADDCEVCLRAGTKGRRSKGAFSAEAALSS